MSEGQLAHKSAFLQEFGQFSAGQDDLTSFPKVINTQGVLAGGLE